jgi:hypothetical protein
MSDKDLECCWNIEGVACDGVVKEVVIFDGHIQVPICEAHLKHHKIVLALHLHAHVTGKDINDLLAMSPAEREKMVSDLGFTLDKI